MFIKLINRLSIIIVVVSDIYLISLFTDKWFVIALYTFLCLVAIASITGTEKPHVVFPKDIFNDEEEEKS